MIYNKKIITIIGARPQFIKAAALSRVILRRDSVAQEIEISEKIVHTGQHYDDNMSRVFFDELDIPQPHYNLEIGSASHGAQTGRMLEGIERILLNEKPDMVLVYGDTNSTFAGALAAVKLHIPVAHVEAGLRSFNRLMPEEINRVMADHVADLLFCPTNSAVENLAKEGVTRGVHQVGDLMYDCALFYRKKVRGEEKKILDKFDLQAKSYYLATVHRAENTDDLARFRGIFDALADISTSDRPVFVPLHPRTMKIIDESAIALDKSIRIVFACFVS